MSFFEFPHTRTYDSDLGWLIKHVGLNIENIEALQAWKAAHEQEYSELENEVEGLINNLVDVISPWDSSIAYHIYSIVEYQGTNYIAIQDVPVGAMITNTEYWQPANTVIEQINAIGVTVDTFLHSLIYTTLEEHGAVGDGTTDDTAALQAAMATGKPIILLDKEYALNFSGDLTSDIYGIEGATIVLPNTPTLTNPMFYVADNITVDNVKFICKNPTDDAYFGAHTFTGIKAYNQFIFNINGDNITIRNIDAENLTCLIFCSSDTVESDTDFHDNITIENIYGKDTISCMNISYCNQVHINNCKFVTDINLGNQSYARPIYIGIRNKNIIISNIIASGSGALGDFIHVMPSASSDAADYNNNICYDNVVVSVPLTRLCTIKNANNVVINNMIVTSCQGLCAGDNQTGVYFKNCTITMTGVGSNTTSNDLHFENCKFIGRLGALGVGSDTNAGVYTFNKCIFEYLTGTAASEYIFRFAGAVTLKLIDCFVNIDLGRLMNVASYATGGVTVELFSLIYKAGTTTSGIFGGSAVPSGSAVNIYDDCRFYGVTAITSGTTKITGFSY